MAEAKLQQGRSRRSPWSSVALAAAGLAAVLGFALLIVRAQAMPDGPVPIIWDREACAHCRMHIGEPGFATQVQAEDGRVLNFDDPGCMLIWLERNSAPVRAVWLHHHTRDEWLSREQARFVPTTPTPMGFGLAVVDASLPGALSFAEARARVLAQGAKEPR